LEQQLDVWAQVIDARGCDSRAALGLRHHEDTLTLRVLPEKCTRLPCRIGFKPSR